MERAVLRARRREPGRPRRVRAEGDVPGIVYGPGMDPVPVRVDGRELARLKGAGHLHGLIELQLDGEPRPVPVLIREVQRHPVRGEILHLDFYRVEPDRPIHVTVPIHVAGIEAVEQRGGVVQHQLHELEVSCLPKDVPDAITVDVSGLAIGDALKVADLVPPAGVRILEDPDEIVLVVVETRAAAEEAGEEAGAGPAAGA